MPSLSSTAACSVGRSADEQERAKRRECAGGGSVSARETSTWWIVGTAEYHVAPWRTASSQNALALKRGGVTTVPPECSVASVDASRPWTWKSGMTQRLTSSGVSA